MAKPTRKDRAKELYDRACRGPIFDDMATRRAYRNWSTTWLIPELCRLIPELKDMDFPKITEEPDDYWAKFDANYGR